MRWKGPPLGIPTTGKPGPMKPELTILLWGLGFWLLAALIGIIPPLVAPTVGSFWTLAAAQLVLVCAIAIVWFVIVGLVRKRWQVLPTLALVAILVLPFRSLNSPIENLWMRKFEASQELRLRFLAYMDQQPTAEQRVELPPDLRTLSDGRYAYLTVDDAGQRYYCYSVFTHGLDNSRGYCWSQSGNPPGELAFPQIVRTKALGGGWFSFSST